MYEITITIPGDIPEDVAMLDIETCKVSADDHIMDNGELLRQRWAAFAAGIATGTYLGSRITLLASYDEPELLRRTALDIQDRTIKYAATRGFDEMILKGRFTNARRSHDKNPFYPTMPGAEDRTWVNIYSKMGAVLPAVKRAPDIDSKNVPIAWERGAHTVVLIHLLRDVAELIIASGDADQNALGWCIKVLRDTKYAAYVLEQ
jgi:hypothetical protein